MEGVNKVQRLIKMAKRKDYYKILGVTKETSTAELRKAYRKLALEWHPDKHEEEEKEAAESKFREITEAYEVLSDDDKRRRYDNGEDVEVDHSAGFHGFPFGGGGPGGPFTFSFNFGGRR